MLFSSTDFLFFFLPITLFIYFVFLRKTKKVKNYFLLLMSLFFYSYGEPKLVLLLITSIVTNYIYGLLIDKYREKKGVSKLIIILMLMTNLGILMVFKYLGFFVSNINGIFKTAITIPNIVLPIGISFYTFQAISYVIDVYRGKGQVQKNILNVGLYLSFFPQLIAGPIVRYETIAEQINNRKETFDDFSKGIYRFLIGLFKKILIANQMAVIADFAFDNGPTSVAIAWIGAIAYAIQIYFDFSGYSDMAIGLGKVFGFKFDENFNYPYISKSITEFWRRWHISLSTWFRDYVYIPFGGSKVSKSRTIFNLLIVWLLTGFWHGASWNFILWGLFFFVLLMIEKNIIKPDKERKWFGNFIMHIYTLFSVLIGWVLFRAVGLENVITYIKSMFGLGNIPLYDYNVSIYGKQKLLFFILGIIFALPLFKKLEELFDKNKFVNATLVPIIMTAIFLICVSFLIKGSYNPFIYFNF